MDRASRQTRWPGQSSTGEARAQHVLTLAGHEVGNTALEAALSMRESIQRYEEQPWPVRRDQLLDRIRVLIRLAEESPDRDDVIATLHRLLDLVEFRLLHDETR